MNEKESFIIEDLDDFHVVIKADEEWRVRKELEAEVRHIPLLTEYLAHRSFPAGEKYIQSGVMPGFSGLTMPFKFTNMIPSLRLR